MSCAVSSDIWGVSRAICSGVLQIYELDGVLGIESTDGLDGALRIDAVLEILYGVDVILEVEMESRCDGVVPNFFIFEKFFAEYVEFFRLISRPKLFHHILVAHCLNQHSRQIYKKNR